MTERSGNDQESDTSYGERGEYNYFAVQHRATAVQINTDCF